MYMYFVCVTTVRQMREYLEAPLRAALEFCDEVETLIKQRAALVLDYDHHKRKLAATVQKLEASSGKRASDIEEKDLAHRQVCASTYFGLLCTSACEITFPLSVH